MRLLVAALVLCSLPLSAAECETQPYADQPVVYVRAVVRALAIAHKEMSASHPPTADDRDARTRAFIARFERLQGEYKCAAAQVRLYALSANAELAASAQSLTFIFAAVGELAGKTAGAHRMYLDGKVDDMRLVAFMNKGSEVGDGLWKLMPEATISMCRSLMASPDRLRLTEGERNEILALLRETFGAEVEEGVQVGQPVIVTTAAALYQFLGKEGWKYRR